MHRDIKPLNIIINDNTKDIKIIDWGLAEFYIPGKKYHPRVATRYYKSPEILAGMEDYHYSLDIWSLGCIFAGIILKKEPFFKGADNPDQLVKIARVMGTVELTEFLKKYDLKIPKEIGTKMPQYFCLYQQLHYRYSKKPFSKFINEDNAAFASKDALDLLSRMLVYDHNARITAKEALSHPYFQSQCLIMFTDCMLHICYQLLPV
eukprot:TRINITY_DN105289_c0_g1_i1.p1 TRINITY_DN105289_c0_g1~~TRINITY_DN105289_c0_g1_i1.p1  ORF type:complete len:206 (+),score=9.66 TRINITY_DN105289_c0_g1_i1:682-1299(+)